MQKVGREHLIDLELALDWDSEAGHHRDVRWFRKFNVWRDLDLLPFELQPQILGQPEGHGASLRLSGLDRIGNWSPELVAEFPLRLFQRQFAGRLVEPRLGRFYPQAMIQALPSRFVGGMAPMRVVALDDRHITCDFNHPLAGRALTLSSCVHRLRPAPAERGGRCQDVIEELIVGPGMQVAGRGGATDFFDDSGLRRMDETDDALFYSLPRDQQHLDAITRAELRALHGRLIPPTSRVLDLMASFDSHLPQELSLAEVAGLGMNADELAVNPRLDQRLVQDLNRDPVLPFEVGQFDAVICTASVEYLVQPLAVFAEVRRVLRPGGLFLISFSNRWFPPKVTAGWIDLHDFERMGLISQYFQRCGGFGELNTLSLQGLERPGDDKYAQQQENADPLFLVWANRVEA